MKGLLTGLIIGLVSLQVSAAELKFSTVTRCDLSSAESAVSLLSGHPILDSHVYKIRQSQKTNYLYEDSDASRGSNVHWQCVNLTKDVNALVISGEFTSNYLQGALFYFDGDSAQVERLNFAERNRPGWILLTQQGPQVIFENKGNESSHKFLSYGRNDAFLEIDELPVPDPAKGETLTELEP
ncbi:MULTISPECIES: hypothetical protein [unclassified Pseudomonas]|uniref:hypothetical protein n=1 Tax=unclassified Pseudomonas TaxID=196821 RepID=UPI000A1FF071|nr:MULTISPECIES: hypothetical protein [unclassified Pseudomonas]QZD68489.1 hypothetical protein K3819_14550 [Pseudomonas sp. 3-2]